MNGEESSARPGIGAIAYVALMMVLLAVGFWALVLERSGNEMRSSLAAAQGQIEQLQTQVGELQQMTQEQAVKLELAQQPDLPLTVKFHRSANGAGFQASFLSSAPSQLEVLVAVTDPSNRARRRFVLTLLPQQPHEGPLGWVFRPGDDLDLTSDGFRPMQLMVPGQQESSAAAK